MPLACLQGSGGFPSWGPQGSFTLTKSNWDLTGLMESPGDAIIASSTVGLGFRQCLLQVVSVHLVFAGLWALFSHVVLRVAEMVPMVPGCCVSSRKRAPPAPGIPGPISVSRAGGLRPGLGYSPAPHPRGPYGLRGCKAGPTRLALSSCPTLTFPMHLQVKQLRLEREREKAMREQELEMLQREKEAEHFKTWEEQEDNFHLQQAKLRCVGDSGARGLPTTMLHPLPLATSFCTQTHGAHVCPRIFALPVHPA